MHDIIAVYKPKGPTSHDVINQIRKITGVRRVGHAGTLDPLASGVLVVGIGRDATKRLPGEVKKEKEYIAEVTFGAESSTDDAEGAKTPHDVTMIPSFEAVRESVGRFKGIISQTPPAYSAVKVKGRSAHYYARAGKKTGLKPRAVEIKEIEVIEYRWPCLILRVVTGPGVYIRSLARDLGRELGVGGYLSELERTRVGNFTKHGAYTIEEFEKHYGGEKIHRTAGAD